MLRAVIDIVYRTRRDGGVHPFHIIIYIRYRDRSIAVYRNGDVQRISPCVRYRRRVFQYPGTRRIRRYRIGNVRDRGGIRESVQHERGLERAARICRRSVRRHAVILRAGDGDGRAKRIVCYLVRDIPLIYRVCKGKLRFRRSLSLGNEYRQNVCAGIWSSFWRRIGM